MGHYFTNESLDDDFRELRETINGTNFVFRTNSGMFSKEHVDEHTKVLINEVINDCDGTSILDLGCAYGVVGIVLAKKFNTVVDMTDINEKAIELAKINSELNSVVTNVFISDGFNSIDTNYTNIVLNPPIRAGKDVCYRLYNEAYNNLTSGGNLYIVIHKKHGAKSTIDYLTSVFDKIEILYKKKGLNVVKATKS